MTARIYKAIKALGSKHYDACDYEAEVWFDFLVDNYIPTTIVKNMRLGICTPGDFHVVSYIKNYSFNNGGIRDVPDRIVAKFAAVGISCEYSLAQVIKITCKIPKQ